MIIIALRLDSEGLRHIKGFFLEVYGPVLDLSIIKNYHVSMLTYLEFVVCHDIFALGSVEFRHFSLEFQDLRSFHVGVVVVGFDKPFYRHHAHS